MAAETADCSASLSIGRGLEALRFGCTKLSSSICELTQCRRLDNGRSRDTSANRGVGKWVSYPTELNVN